MKNKTEKKKEKKEIKNEEEEEERSCNNGFFLKIWLAVSHSYRSRGAQRKGLLWRILLFVPSLSWGSKTRQMKDNVPTNFSLTRTFQLDFGASWFGAVVIFNLTPSKKDSFFLHKLWAAPNPGS